MRGISWGPLLTPDPRAVPEFPNGQSAPVSESTFSMGHYTTKYSHKCRPLIAKKIC
ncbi:unnamed protein product, partial [Staurois parvus]